MQSKAKQSKARQCKAKQCNAKQSYSKQSKAKLGKAKQSKAMQSKAYQAMQSKAKQSIAKRPFIVLSFSLGLSASARGLLGLPFSRLCASPPLAMRAFLLPSRGAVNEPASSVEQPDASNAPSSVEQPAHSFTSIHAVNR